MLLKACWLFISVIYTVCMGVKKKKKKSWCSRFEFLWHQVQVMYSQYLWLKKSCLFMNMHGSFKYAYLQPDEMKVEVGMEIHPIYFTSYCHNCNFPVKMRDFSLVMYAWLTNTHFVWFNPALQPCVHLPPHRICNVVAFQEMYCIIVLQLKTLQIISV